MSHSRQRKHRLIKRVAPLAIIIGTLGCSEEQPSDRLRVSGHVVQHPGGADRVPLHERTYELNADRKRHELLLRSVVELTLEASALRIVRHRTTLSRCTKVVELEAESRELLLCVLDVRKLRRDLPRRRRRVCP